MTCLQHSDGLLVLQGSHFPFLFYEWAFNTFPFLIVWPIIISCKFLFLLNATNGLFWNVSCNSRLIWRTFQCFLILLHITGSFPLKGIRQGILTLKYLIFFFKKKSLFSQYCLPYLFGISRCFLCILFLWSFVSV